MKIFINQSDSNSEIEEILKIQSNFVQLNRFNASNTKDIIDRQNDSKIFCVDNIELATIIEETDKDAIIISINDLIKLWKQNSLNIFDEFSQSVFDNFLIYFNGFSKSEANILKVKAQLMGARIAHHYTDSVTHVLCFNLTEVLVKELKDSYHNRIFSKFFIEFYWKNYLKRFHNEEINFQLSNCLEMKIFANCRFVLIDFPRMEYREIWNMILLHGGSIIHVNRISLATYLICPGRFDIDRFVSEKPDVIPISLYGRIISDRWIIDSVTNGYLMEISNYQINSDQRNICDAPNSQNHEDGDCEITQVSMNNDSSYMASDKLAEGYNSMNLSREEISFKENRRLFLIRDMSFFLLNKILLINSFFTENYEVLLRENLYVNFESLKEIENFFRIIHGIMDPLLEDPTNDSCFGIEIRNVFSKISDLYDKYINDYFTMGDRINRIMKEKPQVKELFEGFCNSNQLTDISYCINIPIKILLSLVTFISDIIANTSCHHPDLTAWKEMDHLNKSILKKLDSCKERSFRNEIYSRVSHCFGKLITLPETNEFWTCVDCMMLSGCNPPIPITLFVFDKSIMMGKLTSYELSLRRYDKIITRLKSIANDEKENQSEMQPQKSISRSTSRSGSIESCSDNNHHISFKMILSKFQKVFTGLSKLNFNDLPSNMYSSVSEISKSDILSISDHLFSSTIAQDFTFEITIYDREIEALQEIKLQVIPRFVKKLSDYKKIKLALPGEFEWIEYEQNDLPLYRFLLLEKKNFCDFFSHMLSAHKNKYPESSRTQKNLNFPKPQEHKSFEKRVFKNATLKKSNLSSMIRQKSKKILTKGLNFLSKSKNIFC